MQEKVGVNIPTYELWQCLRVVVDVGAQCTAGREEGRKGERHGGCGGTCFRMDITTPPLSRRSAPSEGNQERRQFFHKFVKSIRDIGALTTLNG